MKINRNDPCTCGSGLKYKKCCLNKVTESTTLSYAWRKMRSADSDLVEPLMVYALRLFGKQGLEAAWEEFHGFVEDTPEINEEQMVFEQAFIPWFLYNWIPDPNEELIADLPEVIAAEHYLTRYPNRLDSYKKSFIQTNLESHYSIYEVTQVVRQQSITLKDVLRGHQITIHEKRGSESLEKGHIIMARVVTLNEDSIACGIYPQPLPSQYLLTFVEFKQHYGKNKFFTDEMLFELDLEIRTSFIDSIEHLLFNPFPQLQNTDGEELSMNKVHYSLTCTPKRAFDALAGLCVGVNKTELSGDGVYDSNHQLVEISFPWCKMGNSVHKDWNNTVYGHITIKEGSLTVEVNSAERAKDLLTEINSRLNNKEAKYLKTEQQSIKDMLGEPHEKKLNPCDDDPELQAMLQQLSHQHWVSWLDTSIPALNHVTPREAAKTILGRELLEALFVDFHQKNQSGFSQCPVDLHFLRQELDMT
jgi:hypothetical protein